MDVEIVNVNSYQFLMQYVASHYIHHVINQNHLTLMTMMITGMLKKKDVLFDSEYLTLGQNALLSLSIRMTALLLLPMVVISLMTKNTHDMLT